MRGIALFLLLITSNLYGIEMEALFKALEEMEGSTDSRITKTEVGRYCITKAFFEDAKAQLIEDGATGHLLDLEWSDMTSPVLSQIIIKKYWKRYCPKALKDGDIKVLAAKFRKGPRGDEHPRGIEYAERAENLYYEYSKESDKRSTPRQE